MLAATLLTRGQSSTPYTGNAKMPIINCPDRTLRTLQAPIPLIGDWFVWCADSDELAIEEFSIVRSWSMKLQGSFLSVENLRFPYCPRESNHFSHRQPGTWPRSTAARLTQIISQSNWALLTDIHLKLFTRPLNFKFSAHAEGDRNRFLDGSSHLDPDRRFGGSIASRLVTPVQGARLLKRRIFLRHHNPVGRRYNYWSIQDHIIDCKPPSQVLDIDPGDPLRLEKLSLVM